MALRARRGPCRDSLNPSGCRGARKTELCADSAPSLCSVEDGCSRPGRGRGDTAASQTRVVTQTAHGTPCKGTENSRRTHTQRHPSDRGAALPSSQGGTRGRTVVKAACRPWLRLTCPSRSPIMDREPSLLKKGVQIKPPAEGAGPAEADAVAWREARDAGLAPHAAEVGGERPGLGPASLCSRRRRTQGPHAPVYRVVGVAAPVPVVKVVETVLPVEVRVIALVQRSPLGFRPVGVVSPAWGQRTRCIPGGQQQGAGSAPRAAGLCSVGPTRAAGAHTGGSWQRHCWAAASTGLPQQRTPVDPEGIGPDSTMPANPHSKGTASGVQASREHAGRVPSFRRLGLAVGSLADVQPVGVFSGKSS